MTQVTRCEWPGIADPIYEAYHDSEWGVPHADETRLFEKLVLEGFQGGLSWLTILKKRENFRGAFDGFDAERIARYRERDVARLMADPGIVRNRLKIEGAILSARAYLALRETMTLGQFLWGFVEKGSASKPHSRHGDVPAQSAVSQAISKQLKAEGFKFVGPTTMYAFMQSVGMVNDHIGTCHRYGPCGKMQKAFIQPMSPGRPQS